MLGQVSSRCATLGCVNKNIFFVGLILAASGLISPPIALLGGLVYGFALTHPFHVESKRLAKFLLQPRLLLSASA